MGMGPNDTSLLDKLGLKSIHDMSDTELRNLLVNDRKRRSVERVKARIAKVQGKPKKQPTLEDLGFAPGVAAKARQAHGSDELAIRFLKEKGVI